MDEICYHKFAISHEETGSYLTFFIYFIQIEFYPFQLERKRLNMNESKNLSLILVLVKE